MDPVSAISLSATAFGVVDRLAKTLNFLLRLSTRLKYADVKITLLIGFLGSVNTAVYEIGNIAKKLSGHIRYQKLAESLVIALDCTKASLSFLESQLGELQSSSQDERSLIDKFTVILKDAEFQSYVNGVSTNVAALNLVLNALQSGSLLEQHGIMDGVEAQSIIAAVQDETSSLFCHADKQSVQSKRTQASDTSSALDISFAFDAELLRSRTYGTAFRSHIRQAIASGKRGVQISPQKSSPLQRIADAFVSDDTVVLQLEQQMQNKVDDVGKVWASFDGEQDAIAQFPEQPLLERVSLLSLQRNVLKVGENFPIEQDLIDSIQPKVVLLGTSESAKSTLLEGMKLRLEGGWPEAERKLYSEIIFSNLCQGVRTILATMESLKIPRALQSSEKYAKTIFMQPYQLESLPPEVSIAIVELMSDKGFQAALQRRRENQVTDRIDFYLNSIDRIAAEGYIPSEKDIMLSRAKNTGIREMFFSLERDPPGKSMSFLVYDCGGSESERDKWISTFSNVDILLFTVDMGCYDQSFSGNKSVDRMLEARVLFESVVNSEWFSHTEIVLCFTKEAKLAAKLRKSPLETYSPDFALFRPQDSLHISRAIDYIKFLFVSLNRNRDKSVSTLVMADVPDTKDLEAIESLLWHIGTNKLNKVLKAPEKIDGPPNTLTLSMQGLERVGTPAT